MPHYPSNRVRICIALLFLLPACNSSYRQETDGSTDYTPPAMAAAAADTTGMAPSGAADPENESYVNPSTEVYQKIRENEFLNVTASPLATLSVDVDRAAYSNVRRFIRDGQLPPPDAVRLEELVNYFDYRYPQPAGDDPVAITTELTDCPWNKSHRILRVGLQARTVATDALPPSNLVFLIDVSGSMDEPNKLPLLREAMNMLVDNLRPQDKVAIVVYAGNAGLVLAPTPGNEKAAIREALDGLQAGGSTAGGEGILLAYQTALQHYIPGGNNRVILATDGDFNVGISNDNELEALIEKERQKGVFLTCLGFGSGNYKDAKMELLADKGNGNYAYIDEPEEARKMLVGEFGGTLFTVAKDVKAQIEFNPVIVQSYRLLGYENRVLTAEDFQDDKKDAGDMGSGHSVTILFELVPAGDAAEAARPVHPLKYQQRSPSTAAAAGELATVRFRYKQPEGAQSRELVHTVAADARALADASADTRFAAAVALFGMVLRHSQHAGSGSYELVTSLAKSGLGADREGYRAQFLELVERARELDGRVGMRD